MWPGRVEGGAGEICSLQLCPEDGGRILKVGPWKRWTCEIRFVLFPSRGPGWEDDPRPAGQWNGPPLITSGPWTSAGIGGNEINFYFEKFPSFHRGQLETWLGRGAPWAQ